MNHPNFINGQTTSLADPLIILFVGPLIEGFIFPKIEARKGKPISQHHKFIVGFIMVMLANFSAAVIEYVRATKPFTDKESNCAVRGVYMSDMSFVWEFIPMMFTGLGEILVNPVIYQYAFVKAPPKLRSFLQGFNLVAGGAISGAVTTSYTAIMIPDNYNYWANSAEDHWMDKNTGELCVGDECGKRGHVQAYFYTSIVLTFICLVAYFVLYTFGDAKHINEDEDRE